MQVLAGLSCIDYLTYFNESTPLKLIQNILPNFLVKGGDWFSDKIIGKDEVIKAGGKVMSMGFVEGRSTTKIIEKITLADGR